MSFTYHQKLILSLKFVYMSLFNVMYVLCRGRAITNVVKICGSTPCLMLAINTFKPECFISMYSLEPDVKPEDGIYSAYVHRGCQGDNGRHNSKVVVTGNADTVVTLYSSSEAATIGT